MSMTVTMKVMINLLPRVEADTVPSHIFNEIDNPVVPNVRGLHYLSE